jgi:hypothetical protein
MGKHSLLCKIAFLLLLIGGLNWGLVGLGGFLGSDLNVVSMLLGAWPQVEWAVYILVGLSALKTVIVMAMGKGCCEECTMK